MPTLFNYVDILAALPQTQCTQCGYAGCAPYAQAMCAGEADINRCPPGGMAGVVQLAQLTGLTVKPIAAECGETKLRHIAVIDPARCIGCTLCIVACPVDAIVGAPKAMHQVINNACTGCDLCLPPCPVDCISMQRIDGLLDWTTQDAMQARAAHEARNTRLQHESAPTKTAPSIAQSTAKITAQTAAATALERARARRNLANISRL